MYVQGLSAMESSSSKSGSRKSPRGTQRRRVHPLPKCFNAEHEQIPCPGSNESKITTIVIISSIVGTFLLVLLSAILYRHWRRRRAEKAALRGEEVSPDGDAQPLNGREADDDEDDDEDDDRRRSTETLPAYNYEKPPEKSYPFPATYAAPAHPGGS